MLAALQRDAVAGTAADHAAGIWDRGLSCGAHQPDRGASLRHSRLSCGFGSRCVSLAAVRHHQLGHQVRRAALRHRGPAVLLGRCRARGVGLWSRAAKWGWSNRHCTLRFRPGLLPVLAPLAGRPWAQAEIFGLSARSDRDRYPRLGSNAGGGSRWALLAVPTLWCLFSGATLLAMGSREALILFAAAFLAILAAAWPHLSRRDESGAVDG